MSHSPGNSFSFPQPSNDSPRGHLLNSSITVPVARSRNGSRMSHMTKDSYSSGANTPRSSYLTEMYTKEIGELKIKNAGLKQDLMEAQKKYNSIKPLQRKLKQQEKRVNRLKKRLDEEKKVWEEFKDKNENSMHVFEKVNMRLQKAITAREALEDDEMELEQNQKKFEDDKKELQDRLNHIRNDEDSLKKRNLLLEQKQEKFKLEYEQMKDQIEEVKRLDELTSQNQAERIKLDQDRDDFLTLKKLADERWTQVLEKETSLSELESNVKMIEDQIKEEKENIVLERHANEAAAQKLEEFQQEYELGKDAEFIKEQTIKIDMELLKIKNKKKEHAEKADKWDIEKKKIELQYILEDDRLKAEKLKLQKTEEDLEERRKSHQISETKLIESFEEFKKKELAFENGENRVDREELKSAQDKADRLESKLRSTLSDFEGAQEENRNLRFSLKETQKMTMDKIMDFSGREQEILKLTAQIETMEATMEKTVEMRLKDKDIQIERLFEQLKLVHDAARAETKIRVKSKDGEIKQLKIEVLQLKKLANTSLSDLAGTLLTGESRTEWMILQKEKNDLTKAKKKFLSLQNQWVSGVQEEMHTLDRADLDLYSYRKDSIIIE